MKKVGITPAFSFRLFHLRFLCGKSKHHIEFDLIGVGISAEPVGIVTSVSSEEVFAVGTYRLIERAVVYLVIRLNRVALAMKLLKGRVWITAVTALILILLGWVFWQDVHAFQPFETTKRFTVMLEGTYSVDGGKWQTIDNSKTIDEHFHKAVFKGKLTKTVSSYRIMNIISKNVWYTIYDSNGEIIDAYDRRAEEDYPDSPYIGDHLKNTPGYYVNQEYLELKKRFQSDKELTLEVEFPYELTTENFSDCFYVLTCYSDGIYQTLFFEALAPVLMFLLVCFFGVFFFPIASGLLGRIDLRYVAFGALCFFTGIYMVIGKISDYLNLWIIDPTVCLMTDKVCLCLFVLAVMIYLRSLLHNKISKNIVTAAITAYLALTVTEVVLQMTNVADMMATAGAMYIAMIICAVVMISLLGIEIRGKKRFVLFDYLISWVPLSAFLMIDLLDIYLHIPGGAHLWFGLAVTTIYQMVRFAMDFRRQYKEAIHYQQVQRELYEAKVSVMVSQIRPHFMYNALSSIAILCKLNPDTAYTATVTFSDYLRGNMDSLKQTAPVPFARELEHMKKYLYIEKLRFDDQLNIEYDIQATDFEIPLLSIQPLVENAVKHGVGMKEDGGTVKISTRETDNAYEVIVEDDGVGFDTTAERKNDGRSHVGMENTKRRIKEMCGGEVIIESEIGKGTKARVIIPKKEESGQ